MKFELEDCWKHKNCMDAFFFIHSTHGDDGNTAYLLGNWMIQGVDHHWMATEEVSIFINADEYGNWHRYEPVGMFI